MKTIIAAAIAVAVLSACGSRGYVAGSATYAEPPARRLVGYRSACGDRKLNETKRCYPRRDGTYYWAEPR